MANYAFELILEDYEIFDQIRIGDVVDYFGKNPLLDEIGEEAIVDWLRSTNPSILSNDE